MTVRFWKEPIFRTRTKD